VLPAHLANSVALDAFSVSWNSPTIWRSPYLWVQTVSNWRLGKGIPPYLETFDGHRAFLRGYFLVQASAESVTCLCASEVTFSTAIAVSGKLLM